MRQTGAMTDISAPPDVSGRLVSGEAVELDVRVARLGSRSLALSIDLVLLAVVGGIVLLFGNVLLLWAAGAGLTDSALNAALQVLLYLVVFPGIPVTVETLSKGRSPGKLVFGLRVVRDDGGPIRFRHSLIRGVSALAIEFPGVLMPGFTWLVALGVMLVHPAGKRVGDLMAGTLVISERTPATRSWTPLMPVGMSEWSRSADLTDVDDELALAVRHFLARNRDITEPARSRLGASLERELRAVVVPPPPAGAPGWAVLAAVLAERHRRAGERLARNRARTAEVWDTLYRQERAAAPPTAVDGRFSPTR